MITNYIELNRYSGAAGLVALLISLMFYFGYFQLISENQYWNFIIFLLVSGPLVFLAIVVVNMFLAHETDREFGDRPDEWSQDWDE